ncbi:MAG: hypothetical protein IVW54_01725 [Candidatus Binataceae bacterium]|nr:hypothetical protein [Candidatus Binataceae bacterium]
MTRQLPSEFVDLESFLPWALPASVARNKKRLASSMEEIKSFYDAILPRADRILAYLDQYSVKEMPQDAAQLFRLMLALAEVSNAVELFHEPGVTDGCDPSRFVVVKERNP